MKKALLATVIVIISLVSFSQDKIFTKSGKISFYSKTSMEDIEAHNKAAISVLDKTTGQIEFSVLARGFEFQKALMQEHFNENYIESDKFPKITFKGKVDDIGKVNFGKDGRYPVTVSGNLTIHGETKAVTVNGVFQVQNGAVTGSAEFLVVPEDYKINIPGIVRDKISKTVKVTINCTYDSAK